MCGAGDACGADVLEGGSGVGHPCRNAWPPDGAHAGHARRILGAPAIPGACSCSRLLPLASKDSGQGKLRFLSNAMGVQRGPDKPKGIQGKPHDWQRAGLCDCSFLHMRRS